MTHIILTYFLARQTIRDNILFGAPFDQARYDAVISQCALQRDLVLFEAGDQTEVGEKGLTLSGGQKARITLARGKFSRLTGVEIYADNDGLCLAAIYAPSAIVLLDDILSAYVVLSLAPFVICRSLSLVIQTRCANVSLDR